MKIDRINNVVIRRELRYTEFIKRERGGQENGDIKPFTFTFYQFI